MSVQLNPQKLIFGGQALAHTDDQKTVLVWNALPGEVIEVANLQKRKGVYEAWPSAIMQPSPHRIEPAEDHFGSCSPWQTMDYAYENEQKVAIGRETFRHIGRLDWPDLSIVAAEQRLGYRNKIEFSFTEDDAGLVHLAFYGRGSKRKVPVQGCALALPVINDVADALLSWVRTTSMTTRNLKSLIVRATTRGEAMAALFIKDKLELKLPPLPPGLAGLQLVYSTHKSPASVFTEILQTVGVMELTETVGDVQLRYGTESFFQVYADIFAQALRQIARVVPRERPLLDFYAGVGSIGLALAHHVPQVTLVESNAEAVAFAKQNIEANSLTNATAIADSAENITSLIDAEHTLIVDPPRAGLHQKVVDQILAVRPPLVIYLSCNISTQARDLELLSEAYEVQDLQLFNFFPATPHIEGLAVLQPKSV